MLNSLINYYLLLGLNMALKLTVISWFIVTENAHWVIILVAVNAYLIVWLEVVVAVMKAVIILRIHDQWMPAYPAVISGIYSCIHLLLLLYLSILFSTSFLSLRLRWLKNVYYIEILFFKENSLSLQVFTN
jgi:hypothetical protein